MAKQKIQMRFLLFLISLIGFHPMQLLVGAEPDFDQYIQKSMEFWKVPGSSIVIVKDNKVIMAKGFGYKTTEKSKINEVNAETIFPIASLTKSFTSVAGGIFLEQQKADWDTPVKTYWPALKLPDDYATQHLTIRDCLSMRAGLAGEVEPASTLSEKMLIQELSKTSFPCGFRGCFIYQNLLYNLVGTAIENKSGTSWERFIRREILNKLGMQSTVTNHADLIASTNKALPHQMINNAVTRVDFEQLDYLAPGAGLSSNAQDMAKWLQYLLQKDNKIVKDTLTPQTIARADHFFNQNGIWLKDIFFVKANLLTYGMGWFIHDYQGILIYQDPGVADGMNALMALVPELNLGIVILNNFEDPFFSHSVMYHVIDYYRGPKTDWNQPFYDLFKSNNKNID